MSEIKLKSIQFQGLAGTYTIPTEESIQEMIDETVEEHEFYVVSTTAPSDTTKLWLKPNV